VSFGTPGQDVKVAIDTGSNELWVDPVCNSQGLEEEQVQECEADGTYTASSSSTAEESTESNTIQYGSGAVEIQYVTDDISLPDSSINLTDVQFGIATASQGLNEGILGLGFGEGSNTNYPNFVDALFNQKQTNTKAFSVALGSVDADNGGVVIFGGVDTKKFSGKLVSNPILSPQDGDSVVRYWVQMDSISLNSSSLGSHTYNGSDTPVVLDTGSSLSVLPSTVVDAMVSDFQAQLDSSSGLYFVPCDVARSNDGTVNFAFGDATISVPIGDFIWQASDTQCVLGTQAADSSTGITALLGDTFLRSAYVVFDQTNSEILMAQYENCGQDEQAIPTGSSGASSFTGGCGSGSSSSSSSEDSGSKNAGVRTAGSVGFAVAAVAGLAMLMNTL